jgi:hypothetical protein
MKSLFRIRFLLGMIGLLLLVLSLQRTMGPNYRLGGPVEIAYAQGYAHHLFVLGLRIFVAGFGVPAGIALAVYGFLRWRHPSAPHAPFGRTVLLATLAVWAWGLLGVVVIAAVPPALQAAGRLIHVLVEVGVAVAAARVGYYQGRPTSRPVEGITLSGGNRPAGQ